MNAAFKAAAAKSNGTNWTLIWLLIIANKSQTTASSSLITRREWLETTNAWRSLESIGLTVAHVNIVSVCILPKTKKKIAFINLFILTRSIVSSDVISQFLAFFAEQFYRKSMDLPTRTPKRHDRKLVWLVVWRDRFQQKNNDEVGAFAMCNERQHFWRLLIFLFACSLLCLPNVYFDYLMLSWSLITDIDFSLVVVTSFIFF